jgi:DNA polymerase III subunit epsilon
MIQTIVILVIVLIIVFAIKKSKNSTVQSGQNSFESNRPIKLNVSFPDPEKANDYKFYKFVQFEPAFTLEPIYQEIKKRGMKLKPEFEKAIQTKLKAGEFANPLNFKEYFGAKFDFIGIQFLKGTDNLLSAFQIGVCFIQNERIADSDTYNFRPPEQIVETKRFQKTLEIFEINPESIEYFSFKDIWDSFELKEFFADNLIVCWDEESEILEKVLENNRISNYNIKYIKIREIAQDNNLPVLIDSLLTHFKSDLTLKDDLSLIVTSLAIDLKDSGLDLENYIHYLTDNKKKSTYRQIPKSVDSKKDQFIAIDVETAIGKRWSICQIGLAIVENGEVKEVITELIQPPNNEYSDRNIKIHGITAELTKDKPTFPTVWESIYPIIENKKLVAHSAEFDINCLQQTLDYYNIEIPNFEYDCTFKKTGQKLDEACASFNVSLENHHNAGCDAVACAKLYLKVLEGVQPDFSKVKPKAKVKPISNFDGHARLQGNVLKPDLENTDKNSPFYNKKIVFTGVLENISRQEAADIVRQMGADIDTSISKRTNFVITGTDPGPSKINKIIQYNNEGCSIKILYEKDFLKMIEKE